MNIREYRKCNQTWTILRSRQHRAHKTKTKKTKTQNILDTTMRKQTQIMLIRHEPSYILQLKTI